MPSSVTATLAVAAPRLPRRIVLEPAGRGHGRLLRRRLLHGRAQCLVIKGIDAILDLLRGHARRPPGQIELRGLPGDGTESPRTSLSAGAASVVGGARMGVRWLLDPDVVVSTRR